MTVEIEDLKEIPRLIALIEELLKVQKEGTIEKKWLNVEECAYYLGYSKDKVYKLIQEEWLKGVHYHKPTGRVIIDKEAIDGWVRGVSQTFSVTGRVDQLLADIRSTQEKESDV